MAIQRVDVRGAGKVGKKLQAQQTEQINSTWCKYLLYYYYYYYCRVITKCDNIIDIKRYFLPHFMHKGEQQLLNDKYNDPILSTYAKRIPAYSHLFASEYEKSNNHWTDETTLTNKHHKDSSLLILNSNLQIKSIKYFSNAVYSDSKELVEQKGKPNKKESRFFFKTPPINQNIRLFTLLLLLSLTSISLNNAPSCYGYDNIEHGHSTGLIGFNYVSTQYNLT